MYALKIHQNESRDSEFGNPFKGASSYCENDRLHFYGRDAEKNDLLFVIDQFTLSLLYSSSGVGKSSLIKAGIVPDLIESLNYFPVYIQITKELITKEAKNFSNAIVKIIIEEVNKYNKESEKKNEEAKNNHEEAKNKYIEIVTKNFISNTPTITEFLYLSEFLLKNPENKIFDGKDLSVNNSEESKDQNPGDEVSSENEVVIPVLIFDQCEVIFSLNFEKDYVKDLVHDLSYVIESKIPVVDEEGLETGKEFMKGLYENCSESRRSEELFNLKCKLQRSGKWYRFLFSFREEYLPRFESLKNEIPSIFYTNGRFHLDSFSVSTSSEVIYNISKGTIDENISKSISEMISIKDKKDGNASFGNAGEVQPFMLSLVCNSLYPKIAGPGKDNKTIEAIKNKDDSLIDDVIAKYTEKVFSNVSPETRKFIEEDLITDNDKRTMFALIDQKDECIQSEINDLNKQSELRYLNVVHYFGTPHVEILHDRLLKPLIESRSKRRKEEYQRKLNEEAQEARRKFEEENRVYREDQKKKKRRIYTILTTIMVFGLILVFYQLYRLVSTRSFFEDEIDDHKRALTFRIRQNSIAGLTEIFDFYDSFDKIISMPLGDIIPVLDPLKDIRKKLDTTIEKSFKGKPFFIGYPDTSNSKYFLSPKCTFKYRERQSSSELVFYNLNNQKDTGYVPWEELGRIRSLKPAERNIYQRNTYPNDFLNYIEYFFSPNDSFFCVDSLNSVYLYNLYEIFDSKPADPAPTDSLPFVPIGKLYEFSYSTEARFSLDSKLLIFSSVVPNRDTTGSEKDSVRFRVSIWRIGSEAVSPEIMIFPPKDVVKFGDAFVDKDNKINYFVSIENKNHNNNYPYTFKFFTKKDLHTSELTDSISGTSIQNVDARLLISFSHFSIIYFDLLNNRKDSIRTTMEYPQFCNIINDTLILFDVNGQIEKFNLKNKDLLFQGKIKFDTKSELTGNIRSYVSLSENLTLINFSDSILIYDMNRDSILASHFRFYNKRFLQYAYLNRDSTISLIDDRGILFRWYYEVPPASDLTGLRANYELFKTY